MASHIESFDKLEINERGLEFDTVKLMRDEKALDTLGIPIKIVSGMSDRPLHNMFVSVEECTKFLISGNELTVESIPKGEALNTQMYVLLSDEVESITDELCVRIR